MGKHSLGSSPASPLPMSSGAEEAMQEYLEEVRKKVAGAAWKLAELEQRTEIWPKDITMAAPGAVKKKRSWVERFFSGVYSIFSSIPAIAMVSAALAIVFGLLGSKGSGTQSQSALDIAKVFAGAVVGSTGAVTHSAIKNRRASKENPS